MAIREIWVESRSPRVFKAELFQGDRLRHGQSKVRTSIRAITLPKSPVILTRNRVKRVWPIKLNLTSDLTELGQ
ncbi:MAG: hypothetical protein ACRC8Y_00485 [Chroococcales cyanobacterium]